MPYNRPGPGVYVTNGAAPINHGAPCVVDNFVGVAVKQRTRSWADGFANQAIIDPDEPFFIITKGVVQVPDTGLTGADKGEEVYISAAGVLTPGAGDHKFGRIVEVAGERGTPLNRVRVDLDAKDSF
jgi:predicted RecA/RadA family phage recombinase